jgi:hypothetical protein
VSHATEFQLQTTVAKPKISSSDSSFLPHHHFMLIKDFRAIKLGLAINSLNSLSKDKEFAYGTNWKVYRKFQIVTNAKRKL